MGSPDQTGNALAIIVDRIIDDVKSQMRSRGLRAANELRNSVMEVLAGDRDGKTYYVPGTRVKYKASKPGEAPANRTGGLRLSFDNARIESANTGSGSYTVRSITESHLITNGGESLGAMLDEGTPGGKIAPRPFIQPTIDKAMPEILQIYNKPYV